MTTPRKKGSIRTKTAAGLGVLAIGGAAAGLAVAESRSLPLAAPGSIFSAPSGVLDLSGLARDEVALRLQEAWRPALGEPLVFAADRLKGRPEPASAGSLGLQLDAEASAELPEYRGWIERTLLDAASAFVTRAKAAEPPLRPVFKLAPDSLTELEEQVEDLGLVGEPARVKLAGGEIVRTPEVPGVALDLEKMAEILPACVEEFDEPCELPLKEAPKRIADADLDRITEVMAEYTTRYNAGMRSRSENIRLAATMIDGVVVAPGDTFSFNNFLGRRTRAAGFKVAGVYENGRTAEDVGGGICQVSTTLYNASLLGALEIPTRFSHSLPVAYVPMGRDAAVSYPNPDLIIKNPFDHPIALAASVGGGSITFKVLGKKHPYEIEIVRGQVRSKDNGTRRQVDSSLGYGVEKVVHGGAPQRSLSTWRVFRQDGEEVRREELSLSFYRGSARIVAHNPNAPKPAPKAEAPAAAPAAAASNPAP